MPYVITAECVGNKDASCVDVCPVGCIHPEPDTPGYAAAEQLYIDPGACIDCDACFAACPVGAIHAIERVPEEHAASIDANAAYFE
ncbi:ferredoxin family protein [Nocardia sp. NPDC058379]|uniref:4Fe-4S dicluster domain-containing protein n=1 Tax=unclassified Nocardia TaxID=2637762 RepID=UPI00365F0731